MKQIPLTQNKFALVDDEDFEWLNKKKWHCTHGRHTQYARTYIIENNCFGHTTMHRLIMGVKWGDLQKIDHINGNGLDNRRCNLRICTNAQNQYNQPKMRRKCSSTYKGVYWYPPRSAWRARIQTHKKNITIGVFHSEKVAAIAYNLAAKKYFKEFAYLNKV